MKKMLLAIAIGFTVAALAQNAVKPEQKKLGPVYTFTLTNGVVITVKSTNQFTILEARAWLRKASMEVHKRGCLDS